MNSDGWFHADSWHSAMEFCLLRLRQLGAEQELDNPSFADAFEQIERDLETKGDAPSFLRCPNCGGPLIEIGDDRRQCARCGSVYGEDDTLANAPEDE